MFFKVSVVLVITGCEKKRNVRLLVWCAGVAICVCLVVVCVHLLVVCGGFWSFAVVLWWFVLVCWWFVVVCSRLWSWPVLVTTLRQAFLMAPRFYSFFIVFRNIILCRGVINSFTFMIFRALANSLTQLITFNDVEIYVWFCIYKRKSITITLETIGVCNKFINVDTTSKGIEIIYFKVHRIY